MKIGMIRDFSKKKLGFSGLQSDHPFKIIGPCFN